MKSIIKYRHGLIIVILILVSMHTNAQQVLSLESCINMGLERNLDLSSSKYTQLSANIEIKRAKQSRLPNLNANSRLAWNFGRTIDPTSNTFISTTFFSNNYGLSSDVTIYNYNRINNTIRQAQLSKVSKDKDYEQLKLDIALQITATYVNCLFGLENLKNAQLQKSQSEDQLRQMKILIRSGARPDNDKLELLAAIALKDQTIVSFKNKYENALLSLKQLLLLDYDTPLSIEPIGDYVINSSIDAITISQLVNQVIETYPALQSAELRNDIASIQIKVAQSNLYPSLSIGGSLGSNYSNKGKKYIDNGFKLVEQPILLNGQDAILGSYRPNIEVENNPYFGQLSENVSYGFGINLSVPIYNRYQSKASVERAKLSLLQSENNYAKIKNQLIKNLQQVLSDAKSAKKELYAADVSYHAMQSAYDNAKRKHELGTISTFEYLQIENQLESRKLNQIIAKYNFIFKGKLLDYYMGIQG